LAVDKNMTQFRDGRLTRAVDLLRSGVEEGAMPGGVVCLYRNGERILLEAFGKQDESRPATTETVYDLASLTKPLATASSIVTLIEQGRLVLNGTLGTLLGESVPEHLAKITVAQLLTHTSGISAWTACYNNGFGLEAAVGAIFALPAPTATPGIRYEYSCLNFILLARILLKITGQTVEEFAKANVFTPLGLDSLTFHPKTDLERVAPTISREGPNKETVLTGIVHDGNARGIEMQEGNVSGNAGLFGTAADVAAFGEAIRTGKLFAPPTTTRVLSSQIPATIGGHSFLFFAYPNGLCPAGDLFSERAVGHSGYTGTLLLIEPTYDLTVAVLTNSVYGDGKASFLILRRKFLNALAASLA
jgi:CubicO group peptidase (beta-lactamase class C family)